MTDRHHLLVHGETFAAVGDGGDISGVRGGAGFPGGLFVRDARHLSRWQLTVDGAVPETLSPVAEGDTARCVLVPRGGRQEPPAYTLFRDLESAMEFVGLERATPWPDREPDRTFGGA